MSQHPSLRSSDKGKQHRSVLKRYEKIKTLKEKEKWKDGDSVFGLAKVRIMKFKIKKEKAAAVEGAEAGPGTEAAPATPATGAAKAAAPAAKGAPATKAAPAAKAAPAKDAGKAQEGKK